jgi:hypothetical protein
VNDRKRPDDPVEEESRAELEQRLQESRKEFEESYRRYKERRERERRYKSFQ